MSRRLLFAALILASMVAAARGDTVERLNGVKLTGKIVRESSDEVLVRVTIAGKTRDVTIPLKDVHTITVGGKSRTISEPQKKEPPKTGASTGPAKTGGKAGTDPKPAAGGSGAAGEPSKAEIEAQINRLGREKPDWFDDTPLNYPKTLDLAWPEKPPPGWNNQANVGQYLWDVINPNPGKWKEGVRLLHHILQKSPKDKGVVKRCCNSLGHLYGDCLEDHARAAFWWRLGGASDVDLAGCYFRLGSKQMAKELLQKYGDDDTRNGEVIKLWADMGEIDTALRVAAAKAKDGAADTAHLAAGEVYRITGRYAEALKSYEKVLSVKPADAGRDLQRNQNRARAAIEAVKVFDALDLTKIADGSYRSKSLGYEADVEVEVAVKANRIEAVRVTQHREKQFYSALTDTTRRIVEKQGVKGVDATSGATITSQAIINAAGKALASGTK